MTDHEPPPPRSRALGTFLLIGVACAALLAATVYFTRERIAHNHAAREAGDILRLTRLDAPPASGGWEGDVWSTCDGLLLVRGTAQGYGGPIRWMLSADVTPEGPRIRSVLVTSHQETPGIADFLNDPDHPWLTGFAGHGADAAEVDGISGATITTRALARSIGTTLAKPLSAPKACAQ